MYIIYDVYDIFVISLFVKLFIIMWLILEKLYLCILIYICLMFKSWEIFNFFMEWEYFYNKINFS